MRTNCRIVRIVTVLILLILINSCIPLVPIIYGTRRAFLVNDTPFDFVVGDTFAQTPERLQFQCVFYSDSSINNCVNSGDTLEYTHLEKEFGLEKLLRQRETDEVAPVLELVIAYPEIDFRITKPKDGEYINHYIYCVMRLTLEDLESTDYFVHIPQLPESLFVANETPYDLTIGYLIEDENNRQIVCFNPSSCSVLSQGHFSYVPRERYPVSSLKYLSSSCQDSARFVAIYSSCYPEQKPSVLLYDDLVKDESVYWEKSVSIDSISGGDATIVISTVGE